MRESELRKKYPTEWRIVGDKLQIEIANLDLAAIENRRRSIGWESLSDYFSEIDGFCEVLRNLEHGPTTAAELASRCLHFELECVMLGDDEWTAEEFGPGIERFLALDPQPDARCNNEAGAAALRAGAALALEGNFEEARRNFQRVLALWWPEDEVEGNV